MSRPVARLSVPAWFLLSLAFSGCGDVPDISPANEPPQAADDEFALVQDASVVIDVLANDFDIDGDVLTVEITSEPQHGSVEVLDSFVRYTPERLFSGADGFAYRITDTAGFQDEAQVSIDVQRRELRVLFGTTSAVARREPAEETPQRVFLLDSRAPTELVELSASLPAGQSVRAWNYDATAQRVVLLTDADTLVTVPFDPDADVSIFELPVADTETVDPAIDVSGFGLAVYTVDHRHIRTFNLNDETTASGDTGWTDSTMQLQFLTPNGANAVLQGTLGAPANAAIYLSEVSVPSPLALVEDDDASLLPRSFALPASNSMLWLLEQPGERQSGGFTCMAPPAQRLSHLNYVSLANPSVASDLNADSGLLGEPATLIAYGVTRPAVAAFIAGCPAGEDTTRIVRVPFADPSAADVLATAADAAEKLYTVDIAPGSLSLIYAFESATGLTPIHLDLSFGGAETTELSAVVPDYRLFSTPGGDRAPPSRFSDDGRRWLFVAPVGDEPRKLVWLENDENLEGVGQAMLPFAADTPVSDGYHAFVYRVTDSGDTEVALVALQEPVAEVVSVPGTLVRDSGALAEPPVVLAPVPVLE